MNVNSLVTEIGEPVGQAVQPDRLDTRAAFLVIFALSFVCWMPLILPLVSFFHH